MKIAIVTGAGSGIGRATALLLARAGYATILAGRRQQTLDESIQLAAPDFDNCMAVVTDVSDPASVKNLFRVTREKHGRLDLLFNNAGVGTPSQPLEELSLDQWQNIIDINLTGSFLCVQEAFRIMKHQDPMGGRIINNGSISAHIPRPHSAPYTVSKHGITGLTKSASLDGRKYNICVGQIDIGNAATPMAAKMKTGVPQADGSLRIEPTMDVQCVAQAVVDMAGLPLDVNVPFITVMANQMPYMGRG
ncbi:MAG: SDR family oxidoreductase [Saprospiraceae bacterium]|nr:SDR family oxidoreductase [Saprospiraceae bacterium]